MQEIRKQPEQPAREKTVQELERELEQVLEPPLDTSVRHRQELHALPRTS